MNAAIFSASNNTLTQKLPVSDSHPRVQNRGVLASAPGVVSSTVNSFSSDMNVWESRAITVLPQEETCPFYGCLVSDTSDGSSSGDDDEFFSMPLDFRQDWTANIGHVSEELLSNTCIVAIEENDYTVTDYSAASAADWDMDSLYSAELIYDVEENDAQAPALPQFITTDIWTAEPIL